MAELQDPASAALRDENEKLKAEVAALKAAVAGPRPRTTDAREEDQREAHEPLSSEPPAGGSLEAIMAWRARKGRNAPRKTEGKVKHLPSVGGGRSWLSETCLSTKRNPGRTRIGHEMRPFQIDPPPQPEVKNAVTQLGLDWEQMKMWKRLLRPTTPAFTFGTEERTPGYPLARIKEAQWTPGPLDNVPLEGFSQKSKLRLTRGPIRSQTARPPAYSMSKLDRASTPVCVEKSKRFGGHVMNSTIVTRNTLNESELGNAMSTISKQGCVFGRSTRRGLGDTRNMPGPTYYNVRMGIGDARDVLSKSRARTPQSFSFSREDRPFQRDKKPVQGSLAMPKGPTDREVESCFRSAPQVKFGTSRRMGGKSQGGDGPENTPGPGSYLV